MTRATLACMPSPRDPHDPNREHGDALATKPDGEILVVMFPTTWSELLVLFSNFQELGAT